MNATRVIDSQCFAMARSVRRDSTFNYERMHNALLSLSTRENSAAPVLPSGLCALEVVGQLFDAAAHLSDNPRPGLVSTSEVAKMLRKQWRALALQSQAVTA